MTFGTFKKSTLSEEIAARLLALIRDKELRPGDKLPAERELAATMRVSRPSLREALRALAIMNIVEIRQGDGTYVSSLEPGLLVEHLEFVFALDDSTFLELLEARKVIEPGIVEMAAKRITDQEIAELESCMERSKANVNDHLVFLETDFELHDRIAAAARNPVLSRFMASISQLGRASRKRTVEIPGVPFQVVEDHQAIVQAIKDRDPEAARQAMLRHLENVEQRLRSWATPEEDAATSPAYAATKSDPGA